MVFNPHRCLAVCSFVFAALTTLAVTAEVGHKGPPPAWVPLGPAPIETNGSGNIDNVGATDPAAGAIHAIAAHPTDPDTIYIAAVNGGIWKTTNATAAIPTWVQQTDDQQSSAVADIAFDPTDATSQTLVAGFGRFSSFSSRGGARAGVLRTTDGGATWTQVGTPMIGRNISKIVARGNTIVASVDRADSFFCGTNQNTGIFRTTNGGTTWISISGGATGLVGGSSDALAEDPSSNAVLYAAMTDLGNVCGDGDGIFRSADTGATWTKISNATMDALIININSTGNHAEIAVGNGGRVYVGLVPQNTGRLGGVFYSDNPAAATPTWTEMDLPGTLEPDQPNAPVAADFMGIHPGTQGNLHSSMVVDPTDDDIVYIGGDRQPRDDSDNGGFPNSIAACSFAGRLFRGDASLGSGSQWRPLTHDFSDADGIPAVAGFCSNGTAPHPDSRDMYFDANGDLLESDDGGIYRRTSPRLDTGVWVDVNGNMQITEQHSGSFDGNSQIAFSGNQDNGSSEQQSFANDNWRIIQGGDGGDVAVDELVLAGSNQSVRYVSFQRFGFPRRLTYNASNGFVASTTLPIVVDSGAPFQAQFTTPIAVNQAVGGRLIIGGANAVYESTNQGDSITQLTPAITASSGGRRSIAFGSLGNTEVLFVAATDTGLYRHTSQFGALALVYSSSDGNELEGVVVDRTDSSQVFALEQAGVFRSTSSGTGMINITGNLISGFNPGRLRTLAFMEGPGGDALVVGADRGVYRAFETDYTLWTEVATGLPNSPVFDLDYDRSQDRLAAFTLGRGAFALTGAMGSGNLPPTALNDSASTTGGGTVTVLDSSQTSLLFNDSDPDGDNLILQTAAVSGPSNGSVILNGTGNGTFSYTHDNSLATTDSFVYQVCDDGTPSACSTAMVNIAIDVNDPPVAVDDSATTMIGGTVMMLDSGESSLLFNDSDPDGDNLAINTTPQSGPTNGNVMINANGTFSYTHNGTLTSTDSFTYQVCDDGSPVACSTATVNITINMNGANCSAPGAAIPDSATVNDTLNITSTSNLTDLTVLVQIDHTFVGDLQVALTHDDTGTSVLLLDRPGEPALGGFGCGSDDINATFSDAAVSTAENECATPAPAISGTFAPEQPLAGFSGESFGGAWRLTITDNAPGDTGTLQQWCLGPVFANAPPIAVADSLTVAEGATQTVLDGGSATLLNNDSDPEMNNLSVSGLPPVPPSNGNLLLNPDGTFSYAHDDSETTTDTFDYQVCDDGTPSACSTATVSVTITEINEPPVAMDDSLAAIDEDSGTRVMAFADLLGNDNAGPGETAQNLSITNVSNAAGGSVSFGTGMTVEFDPTADFSGSASFDYQISDDGTTNGSADPLFDTATVSFTINPVNDPPTATDDAMVVLLGGTATSLSSGQTSLLFNDSDIENDTLGVQAVPVTLPLSGVVTLNGDGTFSYIHNGLNTDADSFVYQVCDDGSPSQCGQANVAITVSAVNQPPVAVRDSFKTPLDTAFSDTLASNDSDPDSPPAALTWSLNTPPSTGTQTLVLANDGTFNFTPLAGFTGTVRFTYDLTDGETTITGTVVEIGVGELVFRNGLEN